MEREPLLLPPTVGEANEDVEEIANGNTQDTIDGRFHEEARLFEDAISSTGFGHFHYLLLFVCGWALASDSVEIQAVSFVLPSACDLELTSTEKGWLNAIIFVGMMVGGYSLGGVADIKGRRFVLTFSMTINGVFALGSSFANSFLLFLFLRFMSGIGVGAAMPVVFSYFTEFMSRDRRGPMIGVLASFWMVGNIVTAGIAWLIIPRLDIGSTIGNLNYDSWRIFVALCAVPSLSSALFIFLMPESPKFLQKAGRFDDATQVLLQVYQWNNPKYKHDVPAQITKFSNFCVEGSINKEVKNVLDDDVKAERCMDNISGTMQKLYRSTKELFRSPFTSRTWISIFIWFTLSFGFYGLWMWFPELFQRIQSGESSCSRSASHMKVSNPMANMTCEEKVAYNHQVYFESFLVAISNLPGNVLMIISVNKIGRRKLLAASMVVSGVSVFFFWLVTTRTHMIIMSCVFSGLSTAGWNALDVLSMELYPTHLRSTAFGIQAAVGRIGAILANQVFGALVDVHCSIPLFIVAGLLSAGGLTALRLPKTENQSLH